MTPPRYVCWQPLLTDHQAYTLAALAAAGGGTITTVAISEHDADRQAQGWLPMSLADLHPQLLPRRGWRSAVTERLRGDAEAIHIFGSPFGNTRITWALLMAARQGRRVYLISEPYSPAATGYLRDGVRWAERLKAMLRPALYGLYGRLLRQRLAGVFAISPLAVRQYRAIGIPEAKIFPFGYFIPSQAEPLARSEQVIGSELRLCFVGSLIARKGVPDLIAAVRAARAAGARIALDIYGAGTSSNLALDNQIRYRGRIAFGTAPSVMSGYDAVVVPSQHDGWGVVVNEALMADVPVICSRSVGAAAIVDRWGCGVTYDGTRPGGLSSILTSLAGDLGSIEAWRRAAREVRPLLEPSIAGRYMHDAIHGTIAPDCPWYDRP